MEKNRQQVEEKLASLPAHTEQDCADDRNEHGNLGSLLEIVDRIRKVMF